MTKGHRQLPVIWQGYIEVADGHQLYVEECGNPKGQAVIFLHGGPGGAFGEGSKRFFNPEKYRVILFDQRGTGKSLPFLSLENNTPFASVEDMETIRTYFNIESWFVFGGSYGTTLALTYASLHPHRVERLILRGIFLGRQQDIDWMMQRGASEVYWPAHQRLKQLLLDSEKDDIVTAYYHRIHGEDKELSDHAAFEWNLYETQMLNHTPIELSRMTYLPGEIEPWERSIGVLESFYFYNNMFFPSDNFLLESAKAYRHIPMDIFHGRYDMICSVSQAYELAEVVDQVQMNIIDFGGHSPFEEPLFSQLVNHMNELV